MFRALKRNAVLVVVAALLLVGVLATATNRSAHAQSSGLGVVPQRQLTVAPGKSQQDSLYVTNLNKNQPLRLRLTVVDFKSAGQTGTPALQLNANAPQTPWSLKPFIDIPSSVDLGPGATKNIPYTVRIPANQGAGSYYSAVRYTAEGGGSQNLTVSASAASLVFVTVPGQATELMNLKQFGGYQIADNEQDGRFKSLFVTSQPEKLAYVLENAGNVAERPTGSIAVKNIFGKRVALIKDANPKANLALIGQTRRIETCITSQTITVEDGGQKTDVDKCEAPGLWPGWYRAELSVFYGLNGADTQQINATANIWYLPIWFIIAVLLALAIIAYGIYRLRRKLLHRPSHRRGR